MSTANEGTAGARFADPLSAFYIPVTEQQSAARYALKQGDTFAVLDLKGDIPKTENKNTLGIFHNDTRHISGLEILIEGRRPLLLSASVTRDDVLLTVDLANPDIYREGRLILSREMLHIVRSEFLWGGTYNERISLQNFDVRPHRARLLIWFDADFSDMFEIRGVSREAHGIKLPARRNDSSVSFRYRGLDHRERQTCLRFSPAPNSLRDNYAIYDVTLAPHQLHSICLAAEFTNRDQVTDSKLIPRLIAAKRAVRRIGSTSSAISSSNEVFNQFVCRSVSDLHMLVSETRHGLYPYAGIPWFSTAFGRDGIVVALQTLWANPDIARGVLCYLAMTQAKEDDPASDAEPGKILHETRKCEMALTGEVPFRQYYGSIDATPLFIILAGRYFQRTGDAETIRAIWPNILAALDWIDGRGDTDKDGFLEYQARTEKGLSNQGWKDSADSIMHADGTLAKGPIALCEVQAYVHRAKHLAALLAHALGEGDRAEALTRAAAELRRRFEDSFWCEEIGTYALALDGEKKPCRVQASNAGHALFGGIASKERAIRVGAKLMRKESFSGWGIRTLAAGERRFNPMSYHNGSIWPHDNSLIALGLAEYDLKDPVLSIFSGLFDSVHYLDDMRLPELFCGFARRRGQGPTRYPVACSPQAWASATVVALIGALLGLEIDAQRREIRLSTPVLPPGLDFLTLRGLRVGRDRLDLRVERKAGSVNVDLLGPATDVRVIVD